MDTPNPPADAHVGRHYDRAPIKEAIIDIQIDRPPSLTVADLEKLTPPSSQGYSERRKLVMGRLEGRIEAGQFTSKTEQDMLGYQFFGGDGKHVVQFRTTGFTFSRLAPYQDWEHLRDEAKILWAAYRAVVGSAPVTRVGLRYVNQLDLPSALRDFRDYIRSYPEVSTDLPQQLAGFFMQVKIPQVDIDSMLILNESMVPPPSPDIVSVVLDVDVFKIGLKLVSDAEIWNTLEVLRIRKNVVFEGCITNRTRELIS